MTDTMTREDIIRMAQEAQEVPLDQSDSELWPLFTEQLDHFAALVAAAERERMTVNSIHSCHPECDRPGCVAVRKAVEAEREALADYAAALAEAGWSAGSIVDAIRARGSK